jgi:hypothetical protein
VCTLSAVSTLSPPSGSGTKSGSCPCAGLCTSTPTHAKVKRYPKLCHPACPGKPWGVPRRDLVNPWGLAPRPSLMRRAVGSIRAADKRIDCDQGRREAGDGTDTECPARAEVVGNPTDDRSADWGSPECTCRVMARRGVTGFRRHPFLKYLCARSDHVAAGRQAR